MGLDDVWRAITGMFGGGGPTVQPINPDTSAGQPPALSTPGGPVGGSGIGGTPPPTGAAPAVSISPSGQPTPLTQLPQSINIPGMGQVAMPKQTAFDNPWVQAALSAYFAGAGSPRSRGMGGALAEAGKAGIGAYQQARTQQWAPYKTLAELQHAGAETQLAGAQARKADIEARGAESVGRVNQLTGAAMLTHADDLERQGDKVGAQMWRQAGQGISLNTKEVVPYKDAFALGNQLAEQKKTEAATAELQQRKQLDIQRGDVLHGELGVQLSTIDANKARASALDASAKALNQGKVMSEAEMQQLAEKHGVDSTAGMKRATNALGFPTETEQQFEQRRAQQQHAYSQEFLKTLHASEQQRRQGLAQSTADLASAPADTGAGTAAAGAGDTSDTGGGLSDDDIASRHY